MSRLGREGQNRTQRRSPISRQQTWQGSLVLKSPLIDTDLDGQISLLDLVAQRYSMSFIFSMPYQWILLCQRGRELGTDSTGPYFCKMYQANMSNRETQRFLFEPEHEMSITTTEFDYKMVTVKNWMMMKYPMQRKDLLSWVAFQIIEHSVDSLRPRERQILKSLLYTLQESFGGLQFGTCLPHEIQ